MSAGAEFETITPGEMDGIIDRHTRNFLQELARGLGTADFPQLFQTVANATVSFPAPGDPRIGPRAGLFWAVQRVSAWGLGTGDTLQVYRGVPLPINFLGQLSAAQPWFHLGSKGVLLRGEQYLSVAGAGLTATGTITLTGDALECSEPDAYKLIG